MDQPGGRPTYEELLRFRTALDISGDAVYIVDRRSMRFVDVNQTACARMGYSREELLQMGPQDLLNASREQIERVYDEAIAAGASGTTTESSARTKDGRETMTELHRRALRMDDGWYIVSVARDITRRKQAEQAQRESDRQLRLFVDSVPVMSAYWDAERRCRLASRPFADFYGFTVEGIVGKHAREVLGEEIYRRVEGHVARVMEGHPITYEDSRRQPSGELRHFEIRLLPNVDGEGKVEGYFAVLIDTTEYKLTEARIQHVAHHDSLTGLPNRLLFNDRLAQQLSLAKRDSRRFALLYLDLNRFKPVNDALGHAAGDELLRGVATRIRRLLRESDTLARVGGDEFIVILPSVARRDQAEVVAGKIVAALAAPFELGLQRHSVDIGTSIGIALYPDDAQEADTLVKFADAAMYTAKQAEARS